MARGKKTPPETITAILAVQAVTDNASDTARMLNLPDRTVRDIIDKNKDSEYFAKLRKEKRSEFSEKASRIIDKALNRLERTIDDEEQNIPINHLSTVIGTLYDKRALSEGKPTENVKLSGIDMDKLAGLAGFVKK